MTGCLYILKALLCPPVPNLVKSDIRNILVGFAFSAALGISDLTPELMKRFQIRVHRLVMVTSTIGGALGLAKLIYYNQGGIITALMDPDRGYPLGSSLRMDYNFYALPLLLGVLSAFWIMKMDPFPLSRSTAVVCLPLLISAILLSGSRRGLLVVVCAVPLLILWLVLFRANRGLGQPTMGISLKPVIGVIFLAAILSVIKLDSLTEFVSNVTSADSFSEVMKRWETFQEGTYSDTRMHYWTITMQRLSRFTPLEYLFGEGFAYVTDLGADPDLVEDYPHNFLLSSILYGGVLQTVCLLAVVVTALARLSRPSQGCGMFAGWFVIVIIFLATSCNSFFSSEIAVFLTVFGLGVSRFLPEGYGYPETEPSEVHLLGRPA
jgi:hypothetical protein